MPHHHNPAAHYPHDSRPPTSSGGQPTTTRTSAGFVSHYLETETGDGERIGLTLWDSQGLERAIADLQLRQVTDFLESKFEDTFGEETKVVRSPGVKDTHIHCVFLVLDPLRLDETIKISKKTMEKWNGQKGMANGQTDGTSHWGGASIGGLDEKLDLQVLRALQGKTTVIPIISKADTVTKTHMGALKRAVDYSLKQAKLDPFEAFKEDDEEEEDSDDSGAIEDEEDEIKMKKRRAAHARHNSRAFDERDEDRAAVGSEERTAESGIDGSDKNMTAHLDLSSSTDSTVGLASTAPPATSKTVNAVNAEAPVPYLPLSILAPEDPLTPHSPGQGKVGRYFAWGSADPYDPAHCDFVKLRSLVFEEWRAELREASREIWYEGWRTSRLNSQSTNGANRRTGGAGRALSGRDVNSLAGGMSAARMAPGPSGTHPARNFSGGASPPMRPPPPGIPPGMAR